MKTRQERIAKHRKKCVVNFKAWDYADRDATIIVCYRDLSGRYHNDYIALETFLEAEVSGGHIEGYHYINEVAYVHAKPGNEEIEKRAIEMDGIDLLIKGTRYVDFVPNERIAAHIPDEHL